MSIKIGNLYKNSYNEIFELNTDNINPYIIELNNNINHLDKDTLINFKNRYSLGYSSNNLFNLNYTPTNKNIINITSNIVNINSDFNLNNIISSINGITKFTSNINISGDFKIDNLLDITSNIFNVKIDKNYLTLNSNNLLTSNIICNTIYTDVIRNNNKDKVYIYNANFLDFNIRDITFDISLDINNIYNNYINSNELYLRPSLTINKIVNGCNLVELYTSNLSISEYKKTFTINEKGYIGIGNMNDVNFPLTIINPDKTSSNIIYYIGSEKLSDRFILSSNGNIGIGYINNPQSFIDINRIDDYINEQIRNNPIINININYSSNLNYNNNDNYIIKYYSFATSNIIYDTNDNFTNILYSNYNINYYFSNNLDVDNNYYYIFYLEHNDYNYNILVDNTNITNDKIRTKITNKYNNYVIYYDNEYNTVNKTTNINSINKNINCYICIPDNSDIRTYMYIDDSLILYILIVDIIRSNNITIQNYDDILNECNINNPDLYKYTTENINIDDDIILTVKKYIYKKTYYLHNIIIKNSINSNIILYKQPKILESKYNSNIYFSLSHNGNMILGSNINNYLYNDNYYDNYKLYINGNLKTDKIECNDIVSIGGKNNINFGYCNISNINKSYINTVICNNLITTNIDTNAGFISGITNKLIETNAIDNVIKSFFKTSNLDIYIYNSNIPFCNINPISNPNSNLITYNNIFYNDAINIRADNLVNPAINIISSNNYSSYINLKNCNIEYNIRLNNYDNFNKFEILNNGGIILNNYNLSNINIIGLANDNIAIDTNKFNYIINSNLHHNRDFNNQYHYLYKDNSFNISIGYPSQLFFVNNKLNCTYQQWLTNYITNYNLLDYDIYDYSVNIFGNVNISSTINKPMIKIKNNINTSNINIGIGTNPNNDYLLYIDGRTNISNILNTTRIGINLVNKDLLDNNTFSTYSILNNGSICNSNIIISRILGIGNTLPSVINNMINTNKLSTYIFGKLQVDGDANINGVVNSTSIVNTSSISSASISVGSIVSTSILTGSLNYSSDNRLKKNIKFIDNSLNIINNINGYSFLFNDDIDYFDNYKYGFIAQELKPIIPNSVKLNDDGYYSVNYNNIIPLLVNAVNELTKKVNILEKKLENQLEID